MRVRRACGLVPLLLCAQMAWSADCAALKALDAYAETGTVPTSAICTRYLATGGRAGASCHWTFAFRDAKAATFADALWQDLAHCRRGQSAQADQSVNHPDSYDLREWIGPDGTYAISIKDKGKLDKTLVFLRLERD